ncbi:DUF805 domain-containing protein [Nonlabens xiamenensis]|uniref:DUF805 domain-containing protein n=1 Tax=Nonlabens xiamenensis TaxID=2341043 RepID=UPI000F60A37F|nr:DUF805 domain-containing protein [Nonlabens xiamenensis]
MQSSNQYSAPNQHQVYPPHYSYRAHIPPLSFGEAIKLSFENYANFSGRARRSEFWYFKLFQLICLLPLSLLVLFTSFIGEAAAILSVMFAVIFYVALVIPSLSSSVRRFHDTGNSGWLVLLDLFCIGGALSLIFGCFDSQAYTNQYGPDPKRRVDRHF